MRARPRRTVGSGIQQPLERRIFPKGKDTRGRAYEDFRWSRFKDFAPAEMFAVVGEHVFPYLRTELARQLGDGDSTYAHHMKDARFTIPTPALLAAQARLYGLRGSDG